MRVFMTGASGFVGMAVVKELLSAGHEVVGLARSAAAARKLVAAGATAHAGSIEDLESVRRGVEGADGAIHAAFFHALGHMRFATRLRVLLGGSPSKILDRFIGAAVRADRDVITTLGNALGRDRPLLTPVGMLGMTPGQPATEDDAYDPTSFGGARSAIEDTLEQLATRGVRAIAIRLPPIVHGPHDRGFSKLLFTQALKTGRSAYVGDGNNRWPSVHVGDAARLLHLALEAGAAGAKYHGVSEEGIPFRQIAEAIGRQAAVRASSVPTATAAQFGVIAPIVAVDNPASSALTRHRLGWSPSGVGLLADLARPDYFT